MAGRGTDIMLGGNPDFLAREALKKKYSPEVLAVAADKFPTDDPKISRRAPLIKRHMPSLRQRRMLSGSKFSPKAASLSRVPNGTKAAASTISCGVVPAVKATSVRLAFTSRCRTI